MKTIPYKINVSRTVKQIQRMDAADQLIYIEQLVRYYRENVIFVSGLIDLAKQIKVDTDLILFDISLIEKEAEIFEYGRKINELTKIGFVTDQKVIARKLTNQLLFIYQNKTI